MFTRFIVLAAFTLNSLAWGGKESKGGDPRISDLRNRGRFVVQKIRSGESKLAGLLQKGVDHLDKVIDGVDMAVVKYKPDENQTAIRTRVTPGTPFDHTIELNADTFNETMNGFTQPQINRLAIHEFLLAAGERDEKDEISRHLEEHAYDPSIVYPTISPSEFEITSSLKFYGDAIESKIGCTHYPESFPEHALTLKAIAGYRKKYANWEKDYAALLKAELEKLKPKQIKSIRVKAKLHEPTLKTLWATENRTSIVYQKGNFTHYAPKSCIAGHMGEGGGEVKIIFEVESGWEVAPLWELKLHQIRGREFFFSTDAFSAKAALTAFGQAYDSFEATRIRWKKTALAELGEVYDLAFIDTRSGLSMAMNANYQRGGRDLRFSMPRPVVYVVREVSEAEYSEE